ncbi:hypothetical protein BGW80DRAFT_1286130 [Lactifluus volemus]|nr:hypothetical protein BGW80DRAFT_1286130 [Lactifluus volemus]
MVFQPFKEIAKLLASFSRVSISQTLEDKMLLLGFPSGTRRYYYQRYRSLVEEQKWWDESVRFRAFFARSDARHARAPGLTSVPLIMSYVPRLLPPYRDHRRLDDAARECELTPLVYRKWHKLVYPHKNVPSRQEAAKNIRYLSTRDRREIARIARLVTDEAAAQKGFSPSPAYRDLWTSWLECKGPDLTIVFE